MLLGPSFTWRDAERFLKRPAQHRAAYLRRKPGHDFFQTGRNRTWIAAKQSFKNAYRRIKHGVMLFEELNEVLHFRFLRRKIARVLGHFDEAIAIARLLHLWEKEIQDDKVEVLNFVRPAFDELPG